MQVLVSDLTLPGGWCSFCFYLVGRSSCCSCNLCWSCRILLTLFVVGCLWQGFFTSKLYLGDVLFPCYNEFWGGGTYVGVPLMYSEVLCLCDGELNVFYPAEMMNRFVLCWFNFTRWMMAYDFYAWLALGASESLQIYFCCIARL